MYPHDEDWQAPLLKDAALNERKETLTLLTSKRIMQLDVGSGAVCGSYKTCVHCASDPMCAWCEKCEAGNPCQPLKKLKKLSG